MHQFCFGSTKGDQNAFNVVADLCNDYYDNNLKNV